MRKFFSTALVAGVLATAIVGGMGAQAAPGDNGCVTEGPGSCSFTITDETAQTTAGYAIGTDGDWSITHIELDENGQPVVIVDAEGSGSDASLLDYDLGVEYTLTVGGFGGGGAGSVL